MEVKIPREIKDYQEKFILNFTLRQTLSVGIGLIIVVPIFLYGVFVLKINMDIMGWIVVLFSILIFGMGFFKYKNMTLEIFLFHMIKNYFIYPQKRLYIPEMQQEEEYVRDKDKTKKEKKHSKNSTAINSH